MQKNVGTVDRWIRVILGVILLWLSVVGWGPMGWLYAIIGAILVLTGIIGYCGLYKLFGFSTCPTPNAKK